MFILTFVSIVLIFSRGIARCVVDEFNVNGTNWDPFLFVSKDLDELPNYDITRWVRQLHLQQCAFVEIGEGFCAVSKKLSHISYSRRIIFVVRYLVYSLWNEKMNFIPGLKFLRVFFAVVRRIA